MKLLNALVVAALAGKGGKKKAEREAAKKTAAEAAAAAEAAIAAAAAAAAEAERLSFNPEDEHIGPGDKIVVENYGDNEDLYWEILADNEGVTSLTLQFTAMDIDWRKDGCDDYVQIETFSEFGEHLATHSFCGPNAQDDPFMVMGDGTNKFPYAKKNGQKGWSHAWDTFAHKAKVSFVSDDSGNGGGFTLEVSETLRENPCRTRADCIHVGDDQHVCDFNALTKEKVCTRVGCTNNKHCNDGSDGGPVENCQGNVCTEVECTSRDHCTDGTNGSTPQVCQHNICVEVDCRNHANCPPHADGRPQRCDATVCTPVDCLSKAHCGDTGICENNQCTMHQCLGHLSCETDYPGKCADGKCKCESRKCVEKECTKHSHCPNGGLCDNNPKENPTWECYNTHDDGSKTCRSHAQCGAKSKCEDKKCVAVECRTNADCKGKDGKDTWRCHDENSSEELQNTCYAVGCNKHDQCGAKHVCIDNNCEPTVCRTNTDCPGNFLCARPDKKDPTQNFCQAVDCVGHKACKSHPNPECQEGKCLCESNTCVAKPCVTSDHCGDQERCHDNECVAAECSTHSHCAEAIPDPEGGFKPAKCFPNCTTRQGRKYCLPECRAVDCRTESDCDASVPEICDGKTNTCKTVECRGHSFCEDKQLCKNNECVTQQCTENSHCDASNSEVCENNICKKVGCIGHSACGEYERCIEHECIPRDCTINEHCRMNNGIAKCNKITGQCDDVECIGHTSCNRLSESSLGYDCSEGHCLCLDNLCVRQNCRTNAHCGVQERCNGNTCIPVDCTDHAHCDDQQVCFENSCEDVECRTREHCGNKQVCGGEENGNECIDVDCLSHDDCLNFGAEAAYVCSGNECLPVQCRSNDDCTANGENAVCIDNRCSEVDCNSHADCEEAHDDHWKCYQNSCERQECRNNDHCGASELCDRETNTCQEVECRGHNMCLTKGIAGCEEGHCLCKQNECVVQECRTNEHCNDKQRCVDNQCSAVDCTSHDHCLDSPVPGCAEGKCRCEANTCATVECRTSDHCNEDDEICSGETPEDGEEANTCITVECKGHHHCGPQMNCVNHLCEPVDCTEESHCDEYSLCKSGECERQECRSHEHCADFFQDTGLEGYKCIKQQCVNVECTNVGHCGAGQLCDKSTNMCYSPECIGHASCAVNKPVKCGDGKCLCIGNECEKQECRTNTHCGWPETPALCRDNECVSVGCTTHDHCKNLPEGGPTSFCKDNTCDHTAECLVTSDCPAGEPANCENKQCVSVDCNRNTDCAANHICVNQVCKAVECRTSTDCAGNEICINSKCIV